MNKNVILLYPYFNYKSGALNRYVLLQELLKKINIPVKLILIKDKNHNSFFFKIFCLLYCSTFQHI